jgi:hypothetical protein
MLLILSAATVSEDIASQFGRLPPSFLPLGSRRLFSIQAELARGGRCVMTLPDGFEMAEVDRRAIEAAGIELLLQPAGLRLTEALAQAIRATQPDGPISLLYGDTIVRMDDALLAHPDMVAVQDTSANYPWAYVETDGDGGLRFSDAPPRRLDSRRVVCGYYTFSDAALLAQVCGEERSIVAALNRYAAARPLTPAVAEGWYDFGHLPLYFQSKQQIMVKRAFNSLGYEDHLLIKQSDDTQKMRAEAHWYENLPPAIRLHVPRYGGRVARNFRAGYGVEYLYHPLLSDVAAFGTLPLATWLEIVSACFEFVGKCQAIHPPEGSPETSPRFAEHFFQSMVIDKSWSRLARYCEDGPVSLDDAITLNGVAHPPLRQVIERLIALVPPTRPDHVRFWHGDLFFGNMFYDFTARRVLCIDPRGLLGPGDFSLYGDLRYDLAKLAHSIVGQYDKIVLGRALLEEEGPLRWRFTIDEQAHQADLQQIFLSFVTESCGVDTRELLALTALLFFSMLPLHAERPDLQRAFLANGLRLAGEIA